MLSAVRDDCAQEVVPDDELVQLFEAVDVDGSGAIDADEFETFLGSDPLATDMSLAVFFEAMFQLADLWTATIDGDAYADFLNTLVSHIVTVRPPAYWYRHLRPA